MQITKESYGNGRWAVLVSIPGVGTLTLRVRTEQSAETVIRTLGEHVIGAERPDLRTSRTLSGASLHTK